MTVELWLAQLLELFKTHADRVVRGDLSQEEASRHERELMLLARLDLTDEQYAILQQGMQRGHELIAQSRRATPTDPEH